MEIPTHYISARVTVEHSRWDEVHACIADQRYLSWPHLGKGTDNPHFHILIVESDAKAIEKLRKRFKDKMALKGNGQVRFKLEGNGILHAITYCAKEGTPAIHSQEADSFLVESAPPWEQRDTPGIGSHFNSRERKPIHEDHFRELTYRNLEKATLRYHQQYGTKPTLEDTLSHMHQHGWRLHVSLVRGGIPAPYYDEFEAKCKGETTWRKSKFQMMRVHAQIP
jgi:hypothetical protein